MKNYIYITLMIFLFTSCLDENPEYSVNSKTAFEDINTAKMALTGCYGQLTDYSSYGQAAQELLAGATGLGWAQTNGGDQDRYTSLDASISCAITKMYWSGMYKTISECNFFIKNVMDGTLTQQQKEYMKAQAQFVRGLAYFNLLTTFDGVPLRIDPVSTSTINLARASAEDVSMQIEKDWSEALDKLLPKERDGYPSRYTAHAYLAKLYWFKALRGSSVNAEYLNKAKAHCDSVYQKGGYALEKNFANLFVNNVNGSKESIFQLNFTTTSATTGNRGNWLFAPQLSTQKGISWGRIRATKAFHDWFKGTNIDDPRYDVTFLTQWVNRSNGETVYAYPRLSYKVGRNTFIENIDYSTLSDPTNPKISELTDRQKQRFAGAKGEHNGWPFFKKGYDYTAEAQNSYKNIILFRYADFLLMMADVENELGNTRKAIDLSNEVLKRARESVMPAATTPIAWATTLDQTEVRKNIYRERLFELAGETTMFLDARVHGTAFLKTIAERNNKHNVTYALATSDTVGTHNFRDRIFNKGNITEDFLKKNLLLPIPQEELNGNTAITVKDQNFGY